ncbi:hypothetical protein PQX77_015418 [Marasmius sp. AFHP31]|nr:hypothetical protein PQX77_015418 [Marasmius sp. AFHP31]
MSPKRGPLFDIENKTESIKRPRRSCTQTRPPKQLYEEGFDDSQVGSIDWASAIYDEAGESLFINSPGKQENSCKPSPGVGSNQENLDVVKLESATPPPKGSKKTQVAGLAKSMGAVKPTGQSGLNRESFVGLKEVKKEFDVESEMTLVTDDTATILRLETELSQATDLSADLRAQVTTLNVDIAGWKKEARRFQAESKKLKAAVSDLKLEASILAVARSHERKDWAMRQRQFEDKIKKQESELSDLKSAYNNLRSKLEVCRDHLFDL